MGDVEAGMNPTCRSCKPQLPTYNHRNPLPPRQLNLAKIGPEEMKKILGEDDRHIHRLTSKALLFWKPG